MAHELDRLVEAVLAGRKYRNVCGEFVRNVGARELARRRNLKEAIKATKNKLHQVGGAYLEGRLDYAGRLDELRRAAEAGDGQALRKVCREVMGQQSSTRERLAILDQFYATVLAGLGPIRSVLDVACGLNPLAIPWMPLAEDASYYAYDIYYDMVQFLNAFLAWMPVRGRAGARDVTASCPTERVDLALLLKAIPCLDQVDPAAGARLLETLDARYLVVSFPVHSLHGREKGMVVNYESRFRQLVAGWDWRVERFEFATELAFLVIR